MQDQSKRWLLKIMIENNVQPFEGRSVNGRNLREIGGPRKGSYSSRPKGNSAGISCLRMPTRGRQTRPRFRPNCSPAKALHFRSTHSPLPPYDFSIIIPDRPLFRSKAPLPHFHAFGSSDSPDFEPASSQRLTRLVASYESVYYRRWRGEKMYVYIHEWLQNEPLFDARRVYLE